MALTVEDGTGVATADAYLNEAAVITYEAAHGTTTVFNDAVAGLQEVSVRLATQYVDFEYGQRFVGNKGTAAQALEWPRASAVGNDDYAIDSDVVPAKLADAVAELAIKVAGGEDLSADIAAADQNVKVEAIGAGPVREELEYFSGGKRTQKTYPIVEGLLKNLIVSGGTMSRA